MNRALAAACLAAMVPFSACAWVRRENRPVWTAFEDNLVPDSSAAFAVALPVTVPLGLLAIVTDTLVAHPLQVVDDAADAAAGLWRGIDLEKRYYTEAGWVPLRAVATPIWFVGSFLCRSMFDIPAQGRAEADRRERLAKQQRKTVAWLERIAAGGDDRLQGEAPAEVDAAILAALATALGRGTALGRLRVYERCADSRALAANVDWLAGLRDPSAVVRYHVLRSMPAVVPVPDDLLAQLRADPDEAVRLWAARFRTR